jgi:hypothetical protein
MDQLQNMLARESGRTIRADQPPTKRAAARFSRSRTSRRTQKTDSFLGAQSSNLRARRCGMDLKKLPEWITIVSLRTKKRKDRSTKKKVYLALSLALAGCGGLATSEGFAKLSTPVTQLQRVNVQVVRLTSTLTDADVQAQIEAINSQLQGTFRSDWHIDAIASTAPSSLTIFLQDSLPDPNRAANVAGYHIGNQGWINVPLCNKYDVNEWRETLDHEILELLADTNAGTAKGNVAANLGLAERLEVCDQVAGIDNRYSAASGGPQVLCDYTLPSAWGLAPAVAPFDHLGKMTFVGQILLGGSVPR